MFAALVLAVAVSTASPSGTAAPDQTEAWRPMHAYIGTWKSVGAEKRTRVYASAATNHHLEITESGADHDRAVWGIVSYDATRGGLVLRRFVADGDALDLALDPAASTAEHLVFEGPGADTRTRVTYDRTNWNSFVERVERSSGGEPFALLVETRFERKN